jgi:3-dehydroquinate dehydratase II
MRRETKLRILVVSGPNLDRLGTRQPEVYGTTTLDEIHHALAAQAARLDVEVTCKQSNHEGDLVGWLGRAAADGFAAVLVNGGGLSHTSIALLDAALAAGVPIVEVHVTLPEAREAFRRRSLLARGGLAKVAGFGPRSYELALQGIVLHLREGGAAVRQGTKHR